MIDAKTGQPKIIDFGFSTLVHIPKYVYIRCGTPGYVAPEIIRITDVKTARMHTISDIFSAGCIYYALLFNKPIFNIRKLKDITKANMFCEFQIPDYSLNITVTSECTNSLNIEISLLRAMLVIQPSQRITPSQALSYDCFKQKQKV